MALTERQEIYAEYLLKKIGLLSSTDIDNYLSCLEKAFGKFTKEYYDVSYPNGYIATYYRYKYDTSACIRELTIEVKLKRNLGSIELKQQPSVTNISATDLSNFNFCPVSYSISKSFEIKYPTNEEAATIGSNFHESLRLIPKRDSSETFEPSNFEELVNLQISKIRQCKLVFCGHKSEKFFFKNIGLQYIGQPDYIFQDPKGVYFVVEEKFQYKNTYNQTESCRVKFHENHLVQLQSYIDFIPNFHIEYGILIYWYYDYDGTTPYIHDAKLKIIKKHEYLTQLVKAYDGIKKFRQMKNFKFEQQPYTRCVSCVVNKYCAHKTRQHSDITFPYNRYFMKLTNIPFPEELKSNDDAINNTSEKQ